jgi:hypothetical protein
MTSERSIDELLAMKDGELLATLGTELLGNGLGFGLEDVTRARRYAKAWLDERSDELHQKVCGASSVKKLIDQESTDLAANVITVSAVLESPLKSHAVATIVAVFLVRKGLRSYCEEASAK